MEVSTWVALVLVASWQGVGGEECPCTHREADPLFPGAGGSRWDCQYVLHGLAQVPTACWPQHPDVTQVFLDYNEIEHLARDSFSGLPHLQTLHLKHNKISSVEEGALAGMDSLAFLDLSSNQLMEPPGEVWGLTGLTHLYLGDNRLSHTLSYNISNLVNLEVLDLHLNQMSELPYRSLEPLTQLRQLHLYWNMLVELPNMSENLRLQEVVLKGNALLNFPKYVFGNLTAPLTYHFQDNPAYDVWAPMLLPLPDRSHIVMGFDVSVWAEDEQQAQELLQKDWLVQDGLQNILNLADLVRICGSSAPRAEGRLPPC